MIHTGKFKDTYYILDVESGSLHCVDELAYEVGRIIEAGAMDSLPEALTDRFSKTDIEEVLSEFDELQNAGLLFSSCEADKARPQFNEPVIKAMCLHIAHDCNLRCSYCFADEGKYKGERGLMSKETAKAALDFLIEHSAGRHQLEVDFFGGEPLINFETVKFATQYGRELEKKYNKTIRFTMTTNAYHVTDEMVDFINSEMKNLVISIDGRKEIHDAERKNAEGKGSYDKVVANAKKLIAGRGDKEYYIRGTFTANNLDFCNDVKAIADLGFDQISIEPVVTGGDIALKEEHIPRIAEEYEKLGEWLENQRLTGKHLNFFHFMVDFSSGPCLNKRLRGCGAGSEYVAVTPHGDIYPCHQFVDKPKFKMGNVNKHEFDSSVSQEFLNCHVYNRPDCDSCWAKYFCSGGCAADAYQTNGNMMKPHKLSCELEKLRLNTAIGLYIRKQ